MGGMMNGGLSGLWIVLIVVLGLAVIAAGGVVIARALGARRDTSTPIPPADRPAVRQAQDALKMRYANGEITREEYLQGKVELED